MIMLASPERLNQSDQKIREFEYTKSDFERIARILYKISGISLSDRKDDMVYSRLGRRLRYHHLTTFSEYLDFVGQNKDEQNEFVNALTTNLTHFFREEHHFDYLLSVFLPELIHQFNQRHIPPRIRFWSAGCSTGEEPYTLAMIWEAFKTKESQMDFKILATDLDTNVIETAKEGIYSLDKLSPISESYKHWFKKTSGCKENQKQIKKTLKDLIHYKKLNLMKEWPMKGSFQLIICRNVLIYFDKQTQKKLIKRYYDLLEDNGCLILGHSESLGENKHLFESKGKTIFRKLG
jgi:chemotaxis protein methyltransferase CheR